jgi:hypothetical protein
MNRPLVLIVLALICWAIVALAATGLARLADLARRPAVTRPALPSAELVARRACRTDLNLSGLDLDRCTLQVARAVQDGRARMGIR